MPKRIPIVYRHEISPIPAENLQQHLKSLSLADQRVIRDFSTELSQSIKNVGEITALEVIWSIGRLLNRKINDES